MLRANLPGPVGELELAEGRILVGWLFDPAQPGGSRLELHDDAGVIGVFACDMHRADLSPFGIPPGPHGFRLTLQAPPSGLPRLHAFPSGAAVAPPPRPACRDRTLPLDWFSLRDACQALGLGGDSVADRLWQALRARVAAPPSEVTNGLAPPPSPDQAAQAAPVAAMLAAIPMDMAAVAALHDKLFHASQWAATVLLGDAAERLLPSGATLPERLLVQRGRALLQLGRPEAALPALEAAAGRAPPRPGQLFHLGVAYQRLGLLEKAREVFLRCHALDPTHARFMFEAGRICGALSNGGFGALPRRPELLAEAVALLRLGLQQEPTEARARRDLSRLLLQQGEAEAALAEIDALLDRLPEDVPALNERINILLRLGRFEAAEATARKAATLAPQQDGTRFNALILARLVEARATAPAA